MAGDRRHGYLREFPTESPRIAVISALAHARRIAPERFIVPAADPVDDPEAPLLDAYADYLRRVRGLEARSCEGILLDARRFLTWFRRRRPDKGVEALTAEDVLAAVEDQLARSAAPGTHVAAISHIRTLLRFLHWAGLHDQDLARVVPGTPHWRLAHLPSRLAWEDVRRAIDAIGMTTPADIRDRALLLLFATTGMRNGEVRALHLQDIDWRAGEVFVRRTKGKRDRVAPLLEEAGVALADYILRARPKIDKPIRLPLVDAAGKAVQGRGVDFADGPEAAAACRGRVNPACDASHGLCFDPPESVDFSEGGPLQRSLSLASNSRVGIPARHAYLH